MAIIPETIMHENWSNEKVEYAVEDLVEFEANGGTDICGEWSFSGSYSIRVPVGKIGNSYDYEGSLYPQYSKKSRRRKSGWSVSLRVTAGNYGYISKNILNKNTTSKRKARKLIVEAIRAYEQTDQYKQDIWQHVIHPDRREPILKEIKGELYWVATTWSGTWSALQGRTSWSGDERPFGSGQFYTKKINTEKEYPRKEDGNLDWDHGVKVYKDPSYMDYHISGYGMGSGGLKGDDVMLKQKIDDAIWSFNDLIASYHQMQRFAELKGLLKYSS